MRSKPSCASSFSLRYQTYCTTAWKLTLWCIHLLPSFIFPCVCSLAAANEFKSRTKRSFIGINRIGCDAYPSHTDLNADNADYQVSLEGCVDPAISLYIKVSLHAFDKSYLNSDSLIDAYVQRQDK